MEKAEELISYGMSGKGKDIKDFIKKESQEHFSNISQANNEPGKKVTEYSKYFQQLIHDYKPKDTIHQLQKGLGLLIGVDYKRRGDSMHFTLISYNHDEEIKDFFIDIIITFIVYFQGIIHFFSIKSIQSGTIFSSLSHNYMPLLVMIILLLIILTILFILFILKRSVRILKQYWIALLLLLIASLFFAFFRLILFPI